MQTVFHLTLGIHINFDVFLFRVLLLTSLHNAPELINTPSHLCTAQALTFINTLVRCVEFDSSALINIFLILTFYS